MKCFDPDHFSQRYDEQIHEQIDPYDHKPTQDLMNKFMKKNSPDHHQHFLKFKPPKIEIYDQFLNLFVKLRFGHRTRSQAFVTIQEPLTQDTSAALKYWK